MTPRAQRYVMEASFERSCRDLGEEITQKTVKRINELWPECIEPIDEVRLRADRVKQDIRRDMLGGVQDGKIGVVAHSVYLRVHTTSDDFWATDFVNGVK